MTVCYLILCHSSAAFLRDLVRYIHDPHCTILIHVDAKAPADLAATARGLAQHLDDVFTLPSRACSWGGYSLTKPLLDAIDFLEPNLAGWSHLVLLSEQHLPLLTTSELRERLEPRCSYVQARSLNHMHAIEKADIGHRFARRYRELPGVGSFARQPSRLPREWLDRLHHGSQWVVLDAEACRHVRRMSRDPAFWHPFTECLLADELAVPTAVMHGAERGLLTVRNWNPTFVAAPQMGGSDDMVFDEDCHRRALDAGNWFIRKRPVVLPDSVAGRLEERAAFRARDLAAPVDASRNDPKDPDRPDPVADRLGPALQTILAAAYPALTVDRIAGFAHCPTCYLRITLPHWPDALAVYVVSSDLRHMKVLCAVQDVMGDGYGEIERNGYVLSVIKARIHGLFAYREIVTDETLEFGFFVLGATTDIIALAALVSRHVAVAGNFAELATVH